jgi:hypothetical protein
MVNKRFPPAQRADRAQQSRMRVLSHAALAVLALVIATWSWAATSAAHESVQAVLARLTPAQRAAYDAYHAARLEFERQTRAYWHRVEAKRDARRARRMLGQAYAAQDYVHTFPPKYQGPELPADVARMLAEARGPAERAPPLPNVADILAYAKERYGFVPTLTTEHDFKRRYAREALALGLTKDQVVRIYALETGGLGTYDMQSGISPGTRQGNPISSALGYAQLLHANSTSEFAKHGDSFIRRLLAMAAQRSTPPQQAHALRAKAAVLRRMLHVARSIPDEWSAHVRFGGSPAGLGIHALNLDADVGPWLQVLKLRGLKESAARAGVSHLSGAQIELMNLAGPRTGLEMMTRIGATMPTPNFFSEGGYNRNPIVRDKTAAELMQALEARMEANIKKAGSVEFAQVFDELVRR